MGSLGTQPAIERAGLVTPRLPVRAPRIYPDNPHVRICGGLGSATTLVYPTRHEHRCVSGEPLEEKPRRWYPSPS